MRPFPVNFNTAENASWRGFLVNVELRSIDWTTGECIPYVNHHDSITTLKDKENEAKSSSKNVQADEANNITMAIPFTNMCQAAINHLSQVPKTSSM